MNAFSHERAAFAAGESCSGEDLLRLDFTALIQRVISLEEEKLDLQRLVCHLLVKNETLRSQVRQVGY